MRDEHGHSGRVLDVLGERSLRARAEGAKTRSVHVTETDKCTLQLCEEYCTCGGFAVTRRARGVSRATVFPVVC